MGRLSWLGGKDTASSDAASARRARAHRRSIPKAAAASETWEQQDRARFGNGIFRRR
ncbi:hypothetical protein [Streptomyces sp. NRRL F-5123]|uniref:hypothetical protein n=1 Tax=Streptomyces sp. NRRL F-5123 TaxID=1463856 RepID=UPI000AC2D6B3|nr:hypothetical protein [Streptomyces sp. NRRL F-5123]